MKIWQKESTSDIDKAIEKFTVGNDPIYDMWLAPYDILGSIAHTKMLKKVGLLTSEESRSLIETLKDIFHEIRNGNYKISEGMEDIHSQVEFDLTQRLGDTGKKVHTARSRNDQVLVDIRLYLRDVIRDIVQSIKALIELLLSKSEAYKDVLLPGYTHMQAAMPSSFGLWFGAYAENMIDDLQQWLATYRIINQNPLGSSAGYGSSLPIDRQFCTRLLGFNDLNYNVVHAQMGRGRTELFVSFGCAATGNTLAKLGMDICLYSSQNFGFVKLPDEYTTGSSIMPHKKNPDVFELVRAKGNALGQLPGLISGTIGHLPSGYHRDFQILKEQLFPALEQLTTTLDITRQGLSKIRIHKNILADPAYNLIFSVERVNILVNQGIPFRDAYQRVAKEIDENRFDPPAKIHHTHEGSIGQLNTDKILEKLHTVTDAFDFSYQKALDKLIK